MLENHNKSIKKRKRGQKLTQLMREQIKLKIKKYIVRFPLKPRSYILQVVSEETGVSKRNLFKYLKEVEKEALETLTENSLRNFTIETYFFTRELEEYLWKILEENNDLKAIDMLMKLRYNFLKFVIPYAKDIEVKKGGEDIKKLLFKIFEDEKGGKKQNSK